MSKTKAIDKVDSKLAFNLDRKSKIDGRFLLLTLLIGYFSPLFYILLFQDYSKLWNSPWLYPLVVKKFPPFADMRVITAGSECIRKGYNVLVENPCDPWNRPMNYPQIWSVFSAWGVEQSHTVFLGILFGLLFFIFTFIFIGRLNYLEAFIYAIILCSPCVMLAVERGNNDLIIFTLLSISLLSLKISNLWVRIVSYCLVLFAAFLKLYPIFAVVTCLKEKKRIFTVVSITVVVAFLIYFFSELESLNLVSKATPRPIKSGYGSTILIEFLFIKILSYQALLKNFSFLGYESTVKLIKKAVSWLLIAVVLVIAYLRAKPSSNQSLTDRAIALEHIDSFRIGASLYTGTFLLGNNWDYRLIFLLFTIPQILAWIKSQEKNSILSTIALISIVSTVWLSRISSFVFKLNYVSESMNWFLLFFFAYMLLVTLPNQIKNRIYFVS